MKAVLFVIGVLALAVVFGLFEPVPAFATPVTSDDVSLVSEQMSEQSPGLTCIWKNPKGKGRVSIRGIGYYPAP